jgi:hypothetical protein
MLSVVTNTNVDIVKAAMELFIELNMIEVFDDKTIYMNEVEKLIGSETDSAERMRRHRLISKTNDNASQCDINVTTSDNSVTQSKSKEKELEIDLYKEVDVVASDTFEENEFVDNSVDNSTLEYMGGTLGKGVVLLTDAQREELLNKLGLDAFNYYIDRLSTFIIEKDASVKNHYKTILKWAEEDRMI